MTPLYGDFLEGRIAQLFILNVLFLMLVIKNFDAAKASLERTSEILQNYYLDRSEGY